MGLGERQARRTNGAKAVRPPVPRKQSSGEEAAPSQEAQGGARWDDDEKKMNAMLKRPTSGKVK